MYFAGARSKKQIWERLRSLNLTSYSLGAFYSHTKNNMQSYLKDFLHLERMDKILNVLGIEDQMLDQAKTEIKDIDSAISSLNSELYRMGYRGKMIK